MGDGSLYWTLCAVLPSDTFQAARLAELLRYAQIIPLTRAGPEPWTPPAAEETEHWRSVVFGGATELHQIAPAELPEATPGMLCSSCYTVCSAADAHVIPWWNADAQDVFTTYRCGKCWLSSLEETRRFVESAGFDSEAQGKFATFFGRHGIAGGPELPSLPRTEAAHPGARPGSGGALGRGGAAALVSLGTGAQRRDARLKLRRPPSAAPSAGSPRRRKAARDEPRRGHAKEEGPLDRQKSPRR